MAIIREHLAHKGLGLHNDLQNESSIVGNFSGRPAAASLRHLEQKEHLDGMFTGKERIARPDRARPRLGRHLSWRRPPRSRAATG